MGGIGLEAALLSAFLLESSRNISRDGLVVVCGCLLRFSAPVGSLKLGIVCKIIFGGIGMD